MAAAAGQSNPSFAFIFGEDDYGVKQRSRAVFDQWSTELGGMDHEIIDARSGNAGEASKAIAKVREAMNTLPFFGSGKAVWFKDCNFLGDDRTSDSKDVIQSLTDWVTELKTFQWQGVRLIWSASKVDRRKAIYKAIEKLAVTEQFAALSLDDKEWASKAEEAAYKAIRALKKSISEQALGDLVSCVGPNLRLLNNEIEKLVLYVGERAGIEIEDVQAIVTRNKQARAFALADAMADRNLPRTLTRLDEEFWAMKTDKEKSEIGILYGLISKVRAMILLKEIIREKWVSVSSSGRANYNSFKSMVESIPEDRLPSDRRYNPKALHVNVLFSCLGQINNYSMQELVAAMETLMECNQKLISSQTESKLILQQALVQIVRNPASEQTPLSRSTSTTNRY